jgi:hypothetical protein
MENLRKFMTHLSILRPLEIFYIHLVYFVVSWYIFPRFGILDQEKSGNPDLSRTLQLFVRYLPTYIDFLRFYIYTDTHPNKHCFLVFSLLYLHTIVNPWFAPRVNTLYSLDQRKASP